MQMLYIWILAAVVFGVLEGITAQLVSIWFVLGAVAAAVAAACGGAVWLQGGAVCGGVRGGAAGHQTAG